MGKTTVGAMAGAFALMTMPVAATGKAGAADAPPKVAPEVLQFERGLHKQRGDVAIAPAHATLHLGDGYYFIAADEAKTVLTKLWGNPPDAVGGVLGMVLPADKTVIDNVWGAVVTYQDTGHVSDGDATTADYDRVLADLRDGEDEKNAELRKMGYPAVNVVGWAQPPSYSRGEHSLIWARDLRFDGGKVDTLNYDVRLLGRTGVLSLNMVSDMTHLGDVRAAAANFGKAAAFDRGRTYADYDAANDKKAEYGLAGLVAAGVGVAAAKKLGILAIVLGFGKKLVVLVLLAVGVARKWIAKLFGRGDKADYGTM